MLRGNLAAPPSGHPYSALGPDLVIESVDASGYPCDGRVLAHEHVDMARGHAEALAPMVEDVMRRAGCAFSELDRIGVTTGPGTFAGQRVGLAFARALALALKKPAIGVTTLDVMAAEALSRYGCASRDRSRRAWHRPPQSPRMEHRCG